MKPFRDCVVAVISDQKGQVFAGERADRPGVWQLPQGGIDPGEDPQQALFRELREEIGTDQVKIESQNPEQILYEFPSDLDIPLTRKFKGQTQTWFLLTFLNSAQPDINLSDHEFAAIGWKKISTVLENTVHWKKSAYLKGLADFGLI